MQYNPRIIKFLGYIPFGYQDDTVGWLARYKRAMGMNLDHLGEIMGRDPERLSINPGPDASRWLDNLKLDCDATHNQNAFICVAS
jgi:hypothetical protein